MARLTNIYVLLKKSEAFVKAVPIDPKSRNYKEWVKYRAEVKKEIKDIYKILALLDIIPASEIKSICHVVLPKQIFERVAPCWTVPQKQALAAFIRICGTVPTRQVASLFLGPRPSPIKKKG